MSDAITEKIIELIRATREAGIVPPAVVAWIVSEPESPTAPQGRREISESGARAAATALARSGQGIFAVKFLREVYSFTLKESAYIVRALAYPLIPELPLVDELDETPFPFQAGCPLHPSKPDPDLCPRCANGPDQEMRCAARGQGSRCEMTAGHSGAHQTPEGGVFV